MNATRDTEMSSCSITQGELQHMPIYPSGYYVYTYLRSKKSANGDIDTPYYIGKGKDTRAFIRNKTDVRAPKDKSKIIILEEGMTEEYAFECEKLLIQLFGRVDLGTGCLHNKTSGGEGTSDKVYTEEYRKKLSIAALARLSIPENNPMFGKTHSEKVKQDQSKRMLGKFVGDKKHCFGKYGDEHPAANRDITDEYRKKCSAGHKGIKHSEEHKTNNSNAQKQFRWVTKDGVSKRIHKNELAECLSDGWVNGRILRPSMLYVEVVDAKDKG
jgi:hypothetical protein